MNTIISLGGSLIYPDSIDHDFIREFKAMIEEYVEKGHRFCIYCGGGKLARHYQEAAEKVVKVSDDEKDWLGIEATKLNAFFVRTIFKEDDVYKEVVSDPTKKIDKKKPIIIFSGWKPGWSTDYDAVITAKNMDAESIINMSNIDYVYSADPKKDKNAKPLKEVSWDDFKKLVGERWSPGLNMPFDPIAAKEAHKLNLKVYIIGKDLANLRSILEKKEFKGTIIR
jgi:uridylate kinase